MRSRAQVGLVVGIAVLGVLCLAAAAVLRWVVLPNRAEVPSDENTTRHLAGTARVLVNPQAVINGDIRAALQSNVPVQGTRTVKALATTDSAAQLRETRTLTASSGQKIGSSNQVYAVDRTNLHATSDHPSSWDVNKASGLTVNWPIGTDKKDYTGWVPETQSTTTVKYLRKETHNGTSTYVFRADTKPAQIKDKQVLSGLPTTLPVTTLEALALVEPLDAATRAQLAQLLPQLNQQVPLSYTYQLQATYWVQPTTGIVIDTQRHEMRKAGVSVGGATVAAVAPVLDLRTAYTSNTVDEATSDANDAKNSIDLVGTTLPLILLIVGVVLLIAALLVYLFTGRSGRPRPGPPPPSPAPG